LLVWAVSGGWFAPFAGVWGVGGVVSFINSFEGWFVGFIGVLPFSLSIVSNLSNHFLYLHPRE
jgi:hypothetical protein